MLELAGQIESAATLILQHFRQRPRVGFILGTGLGGFAERIEAATRIPYADIPHFPSSTAIGHEGQLICGHLCSVPVVAMQGRFHLYEGYSAQLATLPVRVMKHLGVQILIVTNASGGLNPAFGSGEVMVIEDQLNLTWRNPLIGINDARLGPRFPDMARPFDHELINQAVVVGRSNGRSCHRGVYAALPGPNYETRAEYRMLRRIGADVVGMSTVPEVIVAVHSGLRVLGLSAVTNLCRPDTLESTSGKQVAAAAERAAPQMRWIMESIVANLA